MSFTGKPHITTELLITNDGFFPDLQLKEFLDSYRIPDEYADNTVAYGVKSALLEINYRLLPVKNALINANYDMFAAAYSLAFLTGAAMWDSSESFWDIENYPELNQASIDNEAQLLFVYKKAVFSYAKAFLLQQFNSMNRKKEAENAAKEAPETYQFWANESQKAVYFLIKKFAPDENVTANHGVYVALI